VSCRLTLAVHYFSLTWINVSDNENLSLFLKSSIYFELIFRLLSPNTFFVISTLYCSYHIAKGCYHRTCFMKLIPFSISISFQFFNSNRWAEAITGIFIHHGLLYLHVCPRCIRVIAWDLHEACHRLWWEHHSLWRVHVRLRCICAMCLRRTCNMPQTVVFNTHLHKIQTSSWTFRLSPCDPHLVGNRTPTVSCILSHYRIRFLF